MKQDKDPKVPKVVGHSQSTPSRLKTSPKAPKPDVSPASTTVGGGGGLKARSRSVPPPTDPNKVRRSLGLSKSKSGEEVLMGHPKGTREIEEVKALGRSGNRVVEQFSRPKRPNAKDESDREKKELQERVNCSENLVKCLQSEVLELKAELEKLRDLNVELESKNIQFAEDLAAAQAKISSLSTHDQDRASQKPQTSNFKDVQKLIAKKLENFVVTKSDGKEGRMPPAKISKPVSSVVSVQPKISVNSAPPTAMPPPPPPPPLPRVPTRVSAAKKAPSLVEFYHTLTKREERKDASGPGIHNSRGTNNAHNSIVGEIQNRSTHLLAIKQDVETKGEFIKSLIEKIQTAAYAEIEDLLKFVDWLDSQLSTLADERAVLKHFNWPERKADAMREAAIEYRDLKRLEIEVSSYKDDFSLPCEASLKKITGLLDKSERSIQRLIKLRESTKVSYRECKIPMDWMLDSGMVYKIKQGSMKLAKLYMKRVSMELKSVRNSERESTQEALVLQGVRFAYRAHQFAGGLDSETMCAFEEIRQRVPMNMGGSRELLAGIVS
ncbi:hypothetical protein ACHQM5_026021 [Ranunculus cassubicifolius]